MVEIEQSPTYNNKHKNRLRYISMQIAGVFISIKDEAINPRYKTDKKLVTLSFRIVCCNAQETR
jgi:hypothetical protein